MIETNQYLKSITHDSMRPLSLDVGNETNSAGVTFVTRVIETLRFGKC